MIKNSNLNLLDLKRVAGGGMAISRVLANGLMRAAESIFLLVAADGLCNRYIAACMSVQGFERMIYSSIRVVPQDFSSLVP